MRDRRDYDPANEWRASPSSGSGKPPLLPAPPSASLQDILSAPSLRTLLALPAASTTPPPERRPLLDSDALKTTPHAPSIARLYDTLPLQCGTCGLRLPAGSDAKLQEHYDWHFRRNKEETGSRNRGWFLDANAWLSSGTLPSEDHVRSSVFDDGPKKDAAAPELERQVSSVPMQDAPADNCRVCGDTFDKFYHEDKEDWHYRDTVVHAGAIYHTHCYEDAEKSGTLLSPIPTPRTGSLADLQSTAKKPRSDEP